MPPSIFSPTLHRAAPSPPLSSQAFRRPPFRILHASVKIPLARDLEFRASLALLQVSSHPLSAVSSLPSVLSLHQRLFRPSLFSRLIKLLFALLNLRVELI